MKTPSGWIRGPWVMTILVASLVLPVSVAWGGKGGGRGGRAHRQAAPRRPSAAPRPQAFRMPRASNAAAHPNAAARTNMAVNHAANPKANASGSNNVKANASGSNAGGVKGGSHLASATGSIGQSAANHGSYTYGTGSSAKQYRSYGYGHGSRNRSSGRGYGRSQGNNRALVSRLRSVHSSLARLDHDYQGHRVKAMHSISNAVRMLSHRSITPPGNNGLANGVNNGRNQAVARNGANANANANANGGARQGARMTQAQSDGRMSQALRTTQGIQMQMANQGSNNSSHYAAKRHVTLATREMHSALTVR